METATVVLFKLVQGGKMSLDPDEMYFYRKANMKPDCYKCVHMRGVPGDAHLGCNNFQAKVVGNPHGIKHGWFLWPLNFDPTWLVTCNGFSEDKKQMGILK